MSRRRVVVTGLGTVNAYGAGVEPLAAALAAGETLTRTLEPYPPLPLPGAGRYPVAAVPPGELAAWLPPLEARRMSPPSRFAVAAARMALAAAGVEPPPQPDPATAVAMATSFGPMSYTERLLDQIFAEGPEAASPALFTECVANAPAAQVAIRCRAGGRNHTLCQREAGALTALARGAADVAAGRAERALAGAAEEVTPLVHAVLVRFGALAAEAARPFDRRRDGFVAAAGATVLVLEEERAAARRGAPVLARVRAWGGAFDPTAGRAGWGRGAAALGDALGHLVAAAGLTPRQLDRVVSGASGALAGDRLEALTLRRAWGDAGLPPVVAPKALTGEYGGGFLAAAVLAAAGRRCGPTPGFAVADPALGVVPHDGAELPPPRRLLVSSLAAGGSAAWVILEAP